MMCFLSEIAGRCVFSSRCLSLSVCLSVWAAGVWRRVPASEAFRDLPHDHDYMAVPMRWRKTSISMMTSTTAAAHSSSSSTAAAHLSSSSSSGMSSRVFTYGLGRTHHKSPPSPVVVYVPLTGRSNSATLPQTRGPSFALPPAVVAALCRVRDAESSMGEGGGRPKWEPWCQWLDTLDESPPQKLPPPLERVDVWPPEELGGDEKKNEETVETDRARRRPTVEELLQEIVPHLQQQQPSSSTTTTTTTVVIAGEGEPLLRLSSLLQLVRSVKEHSAATTVRVTTNGLTAAGTGDDNNDSGSALVARSLKEAGVDAVSVSVATHDPNQYVHLLNPAPIPENTDRTITTAAHARVGAFVRAALHVGLDVETTAVAHPDVDRLLTEQYAASLGVTTPIRWRSYWP